MNEFLCVFSVVAGTLLCNPKPSPTPIPTVTVTATPACPSPTPTTLPMRAMWVSDYGATIAAAAKGSAARNTFFNNLAAKGITRIYLEASENLAANQPRLKDFVVDAREHGVLTEFLINGPVSGYTIATGFNRMVTYAGYARAYQSTYCTTGSEPGCAVAFHIDLEPHRYPEWSKLATAQAAFISGLTRVKTALVGSRLTFSADVTNWYDGSGYNYNGGSFTKAIFDAGVDTQVLMNYTDDFTRMKDRASGEVAIACAAGKSVVSGSDAMNEGTDTALTFFEQGWNGATGMQAAWNEMTVNFRDSACFKGNAGFDYDDMVVLK